ncbi:MAG: hypothetical protein KIB08_06255 [Negativicoccus succinicivorans]|uniref:hypothetical protein n=1 Tax=Negativicoccus succinicivorans TaxID=620903 RepID=UPI0026ED904A|nr:hypothetical protein [Negativicoccus succinicivorans]MBS5888090.1 hypothetical protein [Negativicoccus succinicivorans]
MSRMNTLLDESERLGIQAAQAEYEYKLEEAKKTLELRDEGFPATLIPTLTKGDEKVAKMRLARDVAEVRYKSAQERINAVKKEISVLAEEINREWGNAKYGA